MCHSTRIADRVEEYLPADGPHLIDEFMGEAIKQYDIIDIVSIRIEYLDASVYLCP
jgi:hypothetical protein